MRQHRRSSPEYNYNHSTQPYDEFIDGRHFGRYYDPRWSDRPFSPFIGSRRFSRYIFYRRRFDETFFFRLPEIRAANF